MTEKLRPKVVVVGSGFGGISTIQSLKRHGVKAEIVLVTKNDIFEYYPALYKLVTGTLAIEASIPISHIKAFRGVEIKKGIFISADQKRQVIVLDGGEEISYDYLVLALGSETNFFNISGLSDFSLSFKSVKEAFRLKRHFCELFSTIKDHPKEEATGRLRTVIVGGGPSGVELAGDLTHYLRDLAKELGLDPSLVSIDLFEAANRLLPMLPEKASRYAEKRLRMLGVNIYLNRALQAQDIDDVFIKDMQIKSKTVIWTAGTKINSAYQKLDGVEMTDRKRVKVNDFLSLPNDNHVFIIGDGAGTLYSGLAQTAIYDGKFVGSHIARLTRGKKAIAYRPHDTGFIAAIGNQWALMVWKGFVFKGIIPWIMRSVVDLKYLASIVPLSYVVEIVHQGIKYRRSKTYCPIE